MVVQREPDPGDHSTTNHAHGVEKLVQARDIGAGLMPSGIPRAAASSPQPRAAAAGWGAFTAAIPATLALVLVYSGETITRSRS